MKSQEKKTLRKNKQMILFESDFEPKKLFKFIKKFNSKYFGINYDTGNSASLGHNLKEEIVLFKYIKNIHIKDRFYKGKTTRLGIIILSYFQGILKNLITREILYFKLLEKRIKI